MDGERWTVDDGDLHHVHQRVTRVWATHSLPLFPPCPFHHLPPSCNLPFFPLHPVSSFFSRIQVDRFCLSFRSLLLITHTHTLSLSIPLSPPLSLLVSLSATFFYCISDHRRTCCPCRANRPDGPNRIPSAQKTLKSFFFLNLSTINTYPIHIPCQFFSNRQHARTLLATDQPNNSLLRMFFLH